jgi:hypothetical protein
VRLEREVAFLKAITDETQKARNAHFDCLIWNNLAACFA